MVFIKYKSMGDMLADSGLEQTLSRFTKQKKDNKKLHNVNEIDLDPNCERSEDPSRLRPLLKAEAAQESDEEGTRQMSRRRQDNRWSSCKLLGVNYNLETEGDEEEEDTHDDRYKVRRKSSNQFPVDHRISKSFGAEPEMNDEPHWRSVGDFLAAKQEQEADRCVRFTQEGGKLQLMQPQERKPKLQSSENRDVSDDDDDSSNHLWAGGANRQPTARRKRKVAAARLSLSSSALEQRRRRRRGRQSLAWRRISQLPASDELIIEIPVGCQSEKDNGSFGCDAARRRGTMEVTGEAAEARKEQQPSHCFVDVAQLQVNQRPAAAADEKQPAGGQLKRQQAATGCYCNLTVEGCSCRLNKAAAAASGCMDAGVSQSVAQWQLQQQPTFELGPNDNGLGTDFRGVGVDCNGQSSTLAQSYNPKDKQQQEQNRQPTPKAFHSLGQGKLQEQQQQAAAAKAATAEISAARCGTRAESGKVKLISQDGENGRWPQGDAGKNGNSQVTTIRKTTTTSEAAASSANKPLEVNDKYCTNNNNNTTANKLMGSCCDSVWRYALQPAHKSGLYEVAQHQELANTSSRLQPETGSSGSPEVGRLPQEQQQRQEPIDSRVDRNSRSGLAASRSSRGLGLVAAIHEPRVSRFARPGRSPISLQRLTNGRLARHRLKIQQQRQEQLTQLALRERQQLSSNQQSGSNCMGSGRRYLSTERPTTSRGQSSVNTVTSDCRIQVLDVENNPARTNQQQETGPIFFINNLLERLSSCKSSNSHQLDHRLPQSQQQQQVIGPNSTAITITGNRSRAVDLCDNQLPSGSSGSSSNRSSVRSSTNTRGQSIASSSSSSSSSGNKRQSGKTSNKRYLNSGEYQSIGPHDIKCQLDTNEATNDKTGNVIAFNSVNMLRNGSLSDSNHGFGQASLEESDDSDTQTIASSSSSSSLSLNKPFCKVCHVGSTKNGDKLISPCRCSGTMQYIHCGCLLKWLEISNRSNEKPMSCELCAHEYTWHKKFNYKHMQLPKCSLGDIFLHLIFVAAVGIMLFSALAPMLRRKPSDMGADTSFTSTISLPQTEQLASQSLTQTYPYSQTSRLKHHSITQSGHLAHDEKFMLICAASFFISFFLAIYVQTKARDTLYGLIVKFLNMNQTYYITEYDHGQLSANNNTMGGGGGGSCNNNKNSSLQRAEDGSRLNRKGGTLQKS